MDGFIVRPMNLNDLPEMYKIFQNDWIDSENTLKATYNYDSQGILIALNPAGHIVGAIAACILSEEVGFIGYFVIKKELRGKGMGRILLNHGLEHLGDRNIGLNAIENVLGIYLKRGFNTFSFSGIIFRGTFNKIATGPLVNLPTESSTSNSNATVTVKQYNGDYDAQLMNYDITIHPVERRRFLKQWMTSSVTTTYLALSGDDVIIGYGCVQMLEPHVYYFGPVFSDDTTIAKMLLKSLAEHVPHGAALTMEVLETNSFSKEVANSYGLKPSGQYTRLYTKEEIKIPLEKVFVLTTGAMGLI